MVFMNHEKSRFQSGFLLAMASSLCHTVIWIIRNILCFLC